MAKKSKTLGQIAYESTTYAGGRETFGSWNKAPQIVRDVHEEMATAVEKAVFKKYSVMPAKCLHDSITGKPLLLPVGLVSDKFRKAARRSGREMALILKPKE